MNILVTGGTGFLGRHLIKDLSNRFSKSQIYCIVRPTSKKNLISPFNVNFIHADITDYNSLKNIDRNIDIIFHCAGCVKGSQKQLFKINALGTKNVCGLGEKLNVDKIVYVSSISVVNGNEVIPLSGDLPYNTDSNYGESKTEAEKIAIEYRKKGLKIVIIRPCMIYGEGEPHLMPRLLFLLKYRLLPLIGEGKNRLHLAYVKNVTDCMIYSVFNEKMLKGTYFIADREALSVKEVFNIMAHSIGAKPPYKIPKKFIPLLKHISVVSNKIKSILENRVYDITPLLSLGHNPPYPVRKALKKSCNSFNMLLNSYCVLTRSNSLC